MSQEPPRPLSPGISPLLVLAKIRGILDAFTLSRPVLTLAEIRTATGFPTSTVNRLVSNMVAERFLDRDGDGYRIGVTLAYWAAPATRGLAELDVLQPVVTALRDETDETVTIFRNEHDLRVCVAMAETRHAIRREMHIGKILALHTGSAGRVLLAWDDEALARILQAPLEAFTPSTIVEADELRRVVDDTRRLGFATTSDERDEGATGISAPIFDSTGHVFGALGISGPTYRIDPARLAALGEPLVAAAEEATRLIGGRLPA
ncbi:IclR family transcriptional regulator [Frondihabitans australicus]|uniref:IclR family transcriptional regulator n=2 Tax=Frondihabitans australicus TaxID=386892 RepID=A0A495IGB8_9MICO|nr:IclR family transcriptional regulator [Frondihabitans australicus]